MRGTTTVADINNVCLQGLVDIGKDSIAHRDQQNNAVTEDFYYTRLMDMWGHISQKKLLSEEIDACM